MEKIVINISKDFSDAPGSRNISDGINSGEDFYQKLLKPKFIEAKEKGIKLLIDFDNSWGYASSFISGSFGSLADDFGRNTSLKYLEFKSSDDPSLEEKIITEINKSENNA